MASAPTGRAAPVRPSEPTLIPAALWQGVAGVTLLAAAALLPGGVALPALIEGVAILLLAAGGLASLATIPLTRRRDHRGRILAIAVNYLLFLALLFLLLHRLGIFVGIDRLADTFPRALPFLALAFAGFLLATRNDEGEGRSERIGRLLMAGGLLASLVAVGLFPALLAVASRILGSPLHLALTGGVIVTGAALWFWLRGTTAQAFGATVGQSEMISGYLLVSPNVIGFLIFLAGPLLFSLYVSFTEWSAFGSPEWIGLANYRQILGLDIAVLTESGQRASEVLAPRYVELTRFSLFGRDVVIGALDKLFWIALRNTFVFCLLVLPLSVIPALLLANILNSRIPGMRLFRAIFFLPSVAAVVGVAVVWSWLYNSTTGFINYGITTLIGLLDALPFVVLSDPQIRWLSDSDTALLAIVIMAAWRIVGFNTVLFLAGLQGIPGAIYEAASVDGAGVVRQFFSMTIPLLGPTTFFVVTTTLIQALQLFDEVFVMMTPPQGPNNSTLTAVLYLYQNGFQRFNQGYASAVAWVLFLIIFVVTAFQFRLQRANAEA